MTERIRNDIDHLVVRLARARREADSIDRKAGIGMDRTPAESRPRGFFGEQFGYYEYTDSKNSAIHRSLQERKRAAARVSKVLKLYSNALLGPHN